MTLENLEGQKISKIDISWCVMHLSFHEIRGFQQKKNVIYDQVNRYKYVMSR